MRIRYGSVLPYEKAMPRSDTEFPYHVSYRLTFMQCTNEFGTARTRKPRRRCAQVSHFNYDWNNTELQKK